MQRETGCRGKTLSSISADLRKRDYLVYLGGVNPIPNILMTREPGRS